MTRDDDPRVIRREEDSADDRLEPMASRRSSSLQSEAWSVPTGPARELTFEILMQSLKASFPGIKILQGSETEGSSCDLTVVSKLGVGRYGYVEKCQLKLTKDNYQQLVAVKRFYTGHRPSAQQVNHFLREASVLASLNHKSIVRLIGIGSVDGTVKGIYTAQELLEGPNLMEVVEQQIGNRSAHVYRVEDAVRWCLQVAEVLRYLHIEEDLVHRDIKLSNIAVTSTDLMSAEVKLLDWGLATKVTSPELDGGSDRRRNSDRLGVMRSREALHRPPKVSRSHSCLRDREKRSIAKRTPSLSRILDIRSGQTRASPRSSLAKTLTVHSGSSDIPELYTGSSGTAIYMAPEARLSSSIGPELDIYSYGIMMYELMNGTTVLCEAAQAGHTASTGAAALNNNLWRPPFFQRCPPEAIDIITQCWNPDPSRRPSADTIVTSLNFLQDRLRNRRRAKSANGSSMTELKSSQKDRTSDQFHSQQLSATGEPKSNTSLLRRISLPTWRTKRRTEITNEVELSFGAPLPDEDSPNSPSHQTRDFYVSSETSACLQGQNLDNRSEQKSSATKKDSVKDDEDVAKLPNHCLTWGCRRFGFSSLFRR